MGFCFTQCLLYIAIILILCDFYAHCPRFGHWEPLHVFLWPFVMCRKEAKTPLFKVQRTRQELGRWNKNCFYCNCFRDAEENRVVYLFFISKDEWTTIPALQAQVVPGSSCTFSVLVWTSHAPQGVLVSFRRAGCLETKLRVLIAIGCLFPGPLSRWSTGICVYIHTRVCISLLKYVLKTISSDEYLWFQSNTAGFCVCTCSLFNNHQCP